MHGPIDEGGGGGGGGNKWKSIALEANTLYVCVEKRDNFVLGSFITSSESLNESLCSITQGRGLQ